MTEMEQAYSDNKKIIEGKAFSIARRTTIPLDELTAECNLIFCEAYHKYKPNRHTLFSTWLWQMLEWGISEFASRYYGLSYMPVELSEAQCWWKTAITDKLPNAVMELRKAVSNEASVLIGILLSCPQEVILLMMGGDSWRARGRLRELMKKEGINQNKAQAAINELKEAYDG